MSEYVRKGKLAKALDLSWPTVKYYTKVGLFPVAHRTPHGQHLYDLKLIRDRFQRIKQLKRERRTIDEICDMLRLETIVRGTG